MSTSIDEINLNYYPDLESVVKKLFPNEKIISSEQKRVKIYSFIKSKNISYTRNENDFYQYDVIETDKKIFIDKKNITDPLQYFIIDKNDIVKTEDIIEGDKVIKKITMIPKRKYEFQIYHFTSKNPTPAHFVGRWVYRLSKTLDLLFGFMFAKMITEITY